LQLRALTQKLEAEQRLQAGDKLGPFKGAGLDGQAVEVRFDESGLNKVVLFSSTSCPFCKKQNPMWNQLMGKIDRSKYEVIEIFRNREPISQVSAYLKASGFPEGDAAKIILIGDEPLREEKLNSTPMTFIVGENGTVEKAWYGPWSGPTTAGARDQTASKPGKKKGAKK
jgi:peroxiredoxin